jgi:hypothetical protein
VKVGDLVRLKDPLFRASIGLIVDIDQQPFNRLHNGDLIKVQWLGNQCKYDQYRSAKELEVISESR